MLEKAVGTLIAVAVCCSAALAAPAAPDAAAPPAKKAATAPAKKAPPDAAAKRVAQGRYLVKIGGCNDCHTAGYAASAGKVPEAAWLLGDGLGRRGAWGTTYPPNLRLYLARLSEQEWVAAAKKLQTRPPMPWYALRGMRPADLTAIYHFARKLGPSGTAAPAFVPAGVEPKTPFVQYPPPAKQ